MVTGAVVVGTWVTLVDVLVCVTTNLTRGLEAVVVGWGTGVAAVVEGVVWVVVVVIMVVVAWVVWLVVSGLDLVRLETVVLTNGRILTVVCCRTSVLSPKRNL